ncbi:hypothetical protein FO519_001850 [Halicephalobus sp. NKZ332]|nr:hypothetical protein FO519_001850 [Halicephalobus sp. NKZ332]
MTLGFFLLFLECTLTLFIPVKVFIWINIFFGVLGVAFYINLKKRNSYFAEKGIPHPPIDSLFLGNLPTYEKGLQQHLKLLEWEKTYGDTYGIYEGSHKVIVSSDPELINEVLVKQFHAFRSRKLFPAAANDQEHDSAQNLFLAEGNQWKRLRALVSTSLTVNQIKSIEPIIHEVIKEMMEVIERKRTQDPDGIVDWKPDLMNMGFAIISRSALGFKEKFGETENLELLLKAFERGETSQSWKDSFFAGTYEFLPITKHLNKILLFSVVFHILKLFRNMKVMLDARDKETEEERNARQKDFIDFLRTAQVDSSEIEDSNKAVLDTKVQKKMTREELSSTCIMFLIAGTDTTANTIGFLLHDLAKHKEIQQQLYEEINDNILSKEDMTYHKIRELEFLDRVIKESSRLHPIAPTGIARRAREDAVVKKSDGSFLTIEKGVCVQPNLVALHMNEKIWGPNPEEFDPDRFLHDRVSKRSTSAWLSFGAGPRVCPGIKLAIHEMKIAIINILKKYEVDLCDQTELKTRMPTILSIESMKLKLTKRN